MSEERELYEIRHSLECMVPSVDRIANALESIHLRGSVREQIALRLFVQNSTISAKDSFDQADAWIQERDKQRAQAEQGRAE